MVASYKMPELGRVQHAQSNAHHNYNTRPIQGLLTPRPLALGTHARSCSLLVQMATTQGQTTLGKEVAVHDIFQKTLDKTGHWLKDIKNECNLADVHQAYTLLRAVLFTIRYHHSSFFPHHHLITAVSSGTGRL